ncbi:MAG: hypothetical protein HY784_03040, partial [Chloroflexi bacterium]|nr:hypothetical protein [Chloroflexota bacterium]
MSNNGVWGWAEPGATVHLTQRNPGGNIKETQDVTAGPDGNYGTGFTDLLNGDTLEGQYNPSASLLLNLTAQADPDTDTVSGEAEPGAYLWLDVNGHGDNIHREFWVDETGQWSVWVGDQMDIRQGHQVWVHTENRDGHETHFNFGLPSVEVHFRNYDWVQGTMTANSNVHLTLWAEGGAVVKGWRDVGTDGDGWFWADIYDPDGNCCAGTAPGDTLELTAACPAQVRVEIWSPFQGWGEDILTDENCDYFYDFSPNYDVGVGQWVNIWYRRPDGHSLGAVFSKLRLGADQTGDWVWGIVAPNATVNFTLRDLDGNVKAEREALTKDDGFYSFPFEADLAFGDTLEGAYNPSASLLLALSAVPDLDTDAVSGTAVPGSYLWLDVWGHDSGAHREFVVDENGEWSASFAGEFDFRPGDEGVAYTQGRDGHETNLHFWLPFARVNYGWDWADGRAAPGAEVRLEVFRDGLLAATGATVAGGDAWFGIEPRDFEDQHFDLLPGDVGHITGGGLDETVTLIPIDGALDVDADVVSGQMHDAGFPAQGWVEVFFPGGGDWHGRFVNIEADGSYFADFSGEMDIQPHHQAAVWYIDPNGNYAGNTLNIPFLQANANISHDWVNGEASPPGTRVDVTVWRNGEVLATGQANSDWNYWFHTDLWTLDGQRADTRVGDAVEVAASNGHAAWLELIPIAAAPDPAGNTVSGQIQGGPLPVEVDVEVWTENGTGQTVITDEFGDFFADLNPFDLLPGHSVAVWQRRPDGHRVGIVRPALRIAASSAWDWVWGETLPGATVNASVLTGGGTVGTGATVADEDGNYGLDLYSEGERVQLNIGDLVTVEADGYSADWLLPYLTAGADPDNDTVCGQAPPKGHLRIDVWGYGSEDGYADEEGNYCVYVGDWVDIQPGFSGEVAFFDHQRYEFQVGWALPYVQVQETHNWVQGALVPDVDVHVAVFAPDSSLKGWQDVRTDGNGWFSAFNLASPEGWCCIDIAPGDTVEVTGGGLAVVVPVNGSEGHVDIEANTFWGHVSDVPCPAHVRAEIWSPYGPSQELWTDGDCNYFVDFSPYDLRVGQLVNLWYIRPDGNLVGHFTAALILQADITYNGVWGNAEPGVTLHLTQRDPDGNIKETQDVTVGLDGNYGTGFADLLNGDTVEGQYNPSASLLLNLTAQTDPDSDTVFGTAEPGVYLWLDVWGHGSSAHREFFVDENGNWGVSFAGEFDLQTGDYGRVRTQNRDGHETHTSFALPYIRVNQSHNWVDGQTSPNATVWLTLYDGDGNVKGSSSTTAMGDGWFNGVNPCQPGCDILPGDRVHADFSDGVSRDADVLAMAGAVDPDANTAAGQVFGGVFPAPMRGEVWAPGGTATDGGTDEAGNYCLDFNPFDVLPSHMVAVWYFEPDGDQIGIVRAANFVRVYPSDDWLWGQTAPAASVLIVLRDSGGALKGTAS